MITPEEKKSLNEFITKWLDDNLGGTREPLQILNRLPHIWEAMVEAGKVPEGATYVHFRGGFMRATTRFMKS